MDTPTKFLLPHKKAKCSIYKQKDSFLKNENCLSFSDSFGARTQDPNIKSVVLYMLS